MDDSVLPRGQPIDNFKDCSTVFALSYSSYKPDSILKPIHRLNCNTVMEYGLGKLSVRHLSKATRTYGTFQVQLPFEFGLVEVKFRGKGVIAVALFLKLYPFGSGLVMIVPLTVFQSDSNATLNGTTVELTLLPSSALLFSNFLKKRVSSHNL